MAQEELRQRRGRMAKENDEIVNIAEMIVKDGFHTTSTELNAVAEGKSYVAGNIFPTVAANEYAYLHIKTGSKVMVMSYQVLCDALVYYGVYSNATVTANGTALSVSSRNLVTVIAPTTTAFHTPTVSALGSPLLLRTNAAVSGKAKGGESGGDSRLLVIPPNTSIVIAVQNKATNNALISIVAEWLEV